MDWNPHFHLAGKHAFLSASKYHWVNYNEEKLDNTFRTALAAQRGTELHEFASMAIRLGQKLPKTTKTMSMYVNDAIGFRMTPEQVLYYSDNCFGTADAIGFRENKLRIHDLKTGVSPTSMTQLEIYTALFCHEYKKRPGELALIELRLYQNDEVLIHNPDPDRIIHIMDKIVIFDERINQMREEELM